MQMHKMSFPGQSTENQLSPNIENPGEMIFNYINSDSWVCYQGMNTALELNSRLLIKILKSWNFI